MYPKQALHIGTTVHFGALRDFGVDISQSEGCNHSSREASAGNTITKPN